MYYMLLGFIGAVAYICSDKYFSASVAEQEQALGTLLTMVDILLAPHG